MFCIYCGKENKDSADYCKYCGRRIKVEPQMQEAPADVPKAPVIKPKEPVKKSGKGHETLFITAGIILIIMLIFLIFIGTRFLRKTKNEPEETKPGETTELAQEAEEAVNLAELVNIDTTDLSHVIDVGWYDSIDLNARRHTPRQRAKGLDWDNSFYNQLEDTDKKSDANDNIIAGAEISEYCFLSGNNRLICEVYSDPGSGTIYKIVATDEIPTDGQVEITDYYYQYGQPYFIYNRQESLYTPSYASLEKPGIRFYFNNDVLVRSRIVLEGSLKVSQTGLNVQKNKDYEEFDYFKAPDVVKQQYEQFEVEWLNKGYNILDAVRNASQKGRIRGKVVDAQNNPVSSCNVYIQDMSSSQIVYTGVTDDAGDYNIIINRDGGQYRVYAAAGTELTGGFIEGITPDMGTVSYDCGTITLYPNEVAGCEAVLKVCDAETFDSKSSGNSGISSHVRIRRGFNIRTGEIVFEGDTDGSGSISMTLDRGSYTAEVSCSGYSTIYTNFNVYDAVPEIPVYLVKEPSSGTVKVLMTWEKDIDLDLTIFTPYRGTSGKMDHIGGNTLNDGNGNYIAADNSSGCEVGVLELSKAGEYKIYACDYSDVIPGVYKSKNLADSRAKIYVFNDNGLMGNCEVDQASGVIWEAASVSQNRYREHDRVHEIPTGKTWWLTDKNVPVGQQTTEYDTGMRIIGKLEERFIYTTKKKGKDEKYYAMCFDSPVKINVEGSKGKKEVKEFVEIKVEMNKTDQDFDLRLGQYFSGEIKSVKAASKSDPVMTLDSVMFDASAPPTTTVPVPSAYKSLLTEMIANGPIAYNLIYVNNNSTPELVIIDPDDNAHVDGALLYTCDNGEVELVDSLGSFGGQFIYYPYQNLIRSFWEGQGTRLDYFHSFEGHTVTKSVYSSAMDFDGKYARGMYTYVMDGTEYNIPGDIKFWDIKLSEYADDMQTLYKGVDKITGKYIDVNSCLTASSIDDIKFE